MNNFDVDGRSLCSVFLSSLLVGGEFEVRAWTTSRRKIATYRVPEV